jgi:alkylation response protein AidB-like acyl-CoA dehydrogenase
MRREDTREEAAYRAEIRSWFEANAELRSDEPAGPLDHSPEAEAVAWEKMMAWQRKKYDGGWAAITWPTEYGGRGGTPIESMIFNEEQSKFDVPIGFIAASLGMIGPALMRFGTEDQKQYLKAMLRGDEVWCQLFSEPEAGSDLAAVRTRGHVEGDELVINGQKVWTTSAQFSDKGFIVLRTNPDVPKHKGISFALIDMKQPGIEVRPLVTMRGDRHFNEVFLSDVRTPLDHVVNGIDNGWPVTTFVLMNEGAFIGTTTQKRTTATALIEQAEAAGRMQESLVRQRLGETYARERVLALLQDRLKGALLDGRMPDVDGSVLKILTAEWGHERALTAIWLQGAAGLLAGGDAPMHGLWQDQALSRGAMSVGGGTLEVHRNGLGERALGLPREPRFDRDMPFKDLKTGG